MGKEEIQKMISDVDDDGSGTIGYEEFLKMMTHKILNRDPKDEILKAFRLFDDDETGKISFKNLKRVAKELGERMTDEELQEMIDEADRDGDGEVNEEEFLRIKKDESLLSIMLSASDEERGCDCAVVCGAIARPIRAPLLKHCPLSSTVLLDLASSPFQAVIRCVFFCLHGN